MVLLAACGRAPEGPSPEAEVSAFRFGKDPRVKRAVALASLVRGTDKADPRDAIPPIRRPRFDFPAEAAWLPDDDPVLAFAPGGDARAYPIRILDRHEIVNDTVGGIPVAVTYCPLCDSAAAWRRDVEGAPGRASRSFTFGCSGYLLDGDVVLYDEETETFWQQLTGRAIVGPLTGRSLSAVPILRTTWGAWKKAHPKTTVLSWKTEYEWPFDDYASEAYPEYRRSSAPERPGARPGEPGYVDPRLPAKAVVFGIVHGDDALAVPADALARVHSAYETTVGGARFRFDPEPDLATWRAERLAPDGSWEAVPAMRCYWFAWIAFHPATRVAGGPPR